MKKKLWIAINYPLAWLVWGWLVVLILVLPVTAAEEMSTLIPYTKTVLANGLTLVVKEVPAAPIAAVDIWVGTGACNEVSAEAGISHFFEHMLFKGTKKRKVGEIAQAIQAVGGYLNAATSLDYTHYYVVVPSEYLDLALEVEADAIMNSVFDPKEIERERRVIMEEMSLKQDDPSQRLGWIAYQQLFSGTPYANDVLGTAESLNSITRETFLKYHRRYYVPNNTVVVVVGDVKTETVIRKVNELFKDWQPGSVPDASQFKLPRLTGIKRVQEMMQVDQNYFYLGFPGPGQIAADTPALTVLGVILGGGQSSRLYHELREERQLVNTVYAGYAAYQQVGMFSIYAEAKGLKQEELETAVSRILDDVARYGVTDAELARAKAIIRTDLAFAAETNAEIAALLGRFEVGGSVEDALRYTAALQKVTKEDVQRVARHYLTSAAYVAVAIKPQEANDALFEKAQSK
ncbi:MAG TPA: pitrilysin family protein [Bacillota bacterium]